MKRIKKLMAGLLAMMLVLAPAIGAQAAVNITIDGAGGAYAAYRILNLETVLKDGCGHAEGEHVSDCYSYNYTVNDKYRDVLKELFAESHPDASDADILGELEGLTDTETRTFADSVYQKIREKSLEADYTTNNKTIAAEEQGWYLIAEIATDGTHDAFSLVMLDTAGSQDITVTAKEGKPEIEKKIVSNLDLVALADVLQRAGSTTDEVEMGAIKDEYAIVTAGMEASDAATASIGDMVIFKESITLSEHDLYMAEQGGYKLTVHDTMGVGLALDNTGLPFDNSSVFVTAAMHSDQMPVSKIMPITTGCADGCSFELAIDDFKDLIPRLEKANSNASLTIDIFYQAKVTDKAVNGNDGNPNSVLLEYSNDPYDASGVGRTPADAVKVFTFGLQVDKQNGNTKTPLAGAEFELYKHDGTDWTKVSRPVLSESGTRFTFSGLGEGTYRLTESKVPNGFSGMADLSFTVTAEYDKTADDPAVKGGAISETTDAGAAALGTLMGEKLDHFELVCDNFSASQLPSTGAFGRAVLLYVGIGALMTALGVITAVKLRTKKH